MFSLVLFACTVGKIVETNPSTGYFPGNKKATIVLSKPIDLDAHKALIVVPDSDFVSGQLKNVKYFDEVLTLDELENKLIRADLAEKIPVVRSKIGLNQAAKHYKPFLFLRFEERYESPFKGYSRVVLSDMGAMEDYFIAEIYLDRLWTSVNDQNTWYPIFNSIIDYIKQNSKSYRKYELI